ncbi:MAG: hypothetical protein PVI50_01960 [Gammaproteobacteria bacterium]|jgi:hypothetical protein
MLLLTLLPVCGNAATQDELLARLRLDHAALLGAETDYRRQRESGSLTGVEASDYAAYVARLQRRVIEVCAALGRRQVTLPETLPCPAVLPADTWPAAIDLQAEQTRDERIAGLDAELSAGLGEYDEMLLREQERIRAATPRRDEGDTGGGPGQGTAEGEYAAGGQSGAAADSNQAVGRESDENAGNARAGAGDGGGEVAPGPSPPPDIPDGSDDDVVARQLREAAEKETDPELRKKLWEEYRKYKQGIRQAGP